MSFTDQFAAQTKLEKEPFASAERKERVQKNIDKYIPLPIAVPVMGRLSPEPIDYNLGWAVAVPGEQQSEGKPARAALTIGFPDEDTAEDFCFLLNNAREQRKNDRTNLTF